MDYKDTLLMPKTDFPMRGGLPNKEPKIQEEWDAKNIYQKVLDKMKVIRHLFYMMDHRMRMVIYTWAMP